MIGDAGVQERLWSVIADAAQDDAVPGVLAAVIAPDLEVDWRGATRHLLCDRSVSTAPDTPFRIASVTKMMVAGAIFRLVEQDRLALDTPISAIADPLIVAQLREGGIDPSAVRLWHLLGHTSGLRDHVAQPAYVEQVMADPRRRWTRMEQIGLALAAGPPLGAPGEWFQYSDTAYVILGDIVERASQRSLGDAVRALVGFDKLGAHATWWEEVERAPDGVGMRAAQYMGRTETSSHDPSFDLFGGGGLVSTVGDLARVTRALVRGDIFARTGTSAAAFLISPAIRAPAAVFVHSNAFMLFPVGDRFGWGHAGFWGCVGVHLPDRDITIAATINQARPQQPDRLFSLVASLYGAL